MDLGRLHWYGVSACPNILPPWRTNQICGLNLDVSLRIFNNEILTTKLVRYQHNFVYGIQRNGWKSQNENRILLTIKSIAEISFQCVQNLSIFIVWFFIFNCFGMQDITARVYNPLPRHSCRTLQLVCTAPYLVTLLSFFIFPESVRWLRVKNKQEQLTKTLRRIAFWNRREFPDDLRLEPIAEKVVGRKFSPIDVFRGPGMAVRSAILGYVWFANGMNSKIVLNFKRETYLSLIIQKRCKNCYCFIIEWFHFFFYSSRYDILRFLFVRWKSRGLSLRQLCPHGGDRSTWQCYQRLFMPSNRSQENDNYRHVVGEHIFFLVGLSAWRQFDGSSSHVCPDRYFVHLWVKHFRNVLKFITEYHIIKITHRGSDRSTRFL